jgi:glycine cleavage system H protein
MDGFTYTNMFETKGIEYLAIIAFLILLIPFWVILNKRAQIAKQIRKTLGTLSANILRIPQGLYYSRNHTWTHLDRSGNARVGLDDLLVHLTGEMNFRSLKNPGETVSKGEFLAEFEQQGKQLRVYSPVSGKVMDVNQLLAEDPAVLNEDPYGKGWLYQIKPTDWKAETASLYLAGETTDWFKMELERFKDFLAGSLNYRSRGSSMVFLQDGGELIDHSLSTLPGELWQDFQKEFLDPDRPVG